MRALQEHGREQTGHENLHRQQDVAAHLGRHSEFLKLAWDLWLPASGC